MGLIQSDTCLGGDDFFDPSSSDPSVSKDGLDGVLAQVASFDGIIKDNEEAKKRRSQQEKQ